VTDPLPTDGLLLSSQLTMPLYASPAMRALLTDRARLQRMLDFEAALARAEAAVGAIPATVMSEIGEACKAERYNISLLVEASIPTGNFATAVVAALTNEVARRNPQAAGFVHWGATSQDVIDTALALELRGAMDALLLDLDIAIKGFNALAGRHRRTLSVARTLLQQALPMPFGLKLAGYAAALARSRERLSRLRREALALQFGGAAGTLAALGDRGFGVAERLAALLDLPLPDAPWHAHRDRFAEIASAFAILTGTCGKIAGDVALMMQTEVSEAFEPSPTGRGGSSTMPHKRNPMGAVAALSAATIAPNLTATLFAAQVQQHERGIGGWQTEWITLPALALVTSGALHAVAEIAEGLEIDVDRLRANLDASSGQIMAEAVSYALAEKLGRIEAHRLVQELSHQAAKEKRPLKELLLGNLRVKSLMGSAEVEKLFIPLTYQGSAQMFIDRLVMSSSTRQARRVEPRVDFKSETKSENWQDIRMVEPRLPNAPQLRSLEPETPAPRVEMPPAPSVLASSASMPSPPAPPPDLDQTASPAEPPRAQALDQVPDAVDRAAPDMKVTPADRIEPPAEHATAAHASDPVPKPGPPPPPDDDAPGAFMDVLSRADAEAQAAAHDDGKKPS
jgi:3-carboxy-cis,cis-muconate cycloisomerase